MGGSSFLFTCMSIGIILSVARNVEITEGKVEPESVFDEMGVKKEVEPVVVTA